LSAKLTGRIAVVTGRASGMGAAHSRILAEHGATVAICDIEVDQDEAPARDIDAVFYKLDVCDETEWSQVLDAIAARYGPVTILVNNAGKGHVAAVQDTTTDDWNRIMAINVTGPFFGIRAVTPQMKTAGGGVIVNVSSSAALRGMAQLAAYTTSKWALRGFTKAAAMDLAPDNIRVLSLHPALVRTPMSSGLDLAAQTAGYPIPRAGEPDELARMLLFMVADATFSTGSDFVADGGSVL
jgi:3alpha(or 20beta)-hydroxysteroid dehydrogenase